MSSAMQSHVPSGLGSKYLARKEKASAKAIPSTISLGLVKDGLLPVLHTLNVIKPMDDVVMIDFDWHNIKDDVCPVTIYVKERS